MHWISASRCRNVVLIRLKCDRVSLPPAADGDLPDRMFPGKTGSRDHASGSNGKFDDLTVCLSVRGIRADSSGQGNELLVRRPDVRVVAGKCPDIRAGDEEVRYPEEPVPGRIGTGGELFVRVSRICHDSKPRFPDLLSHRSKCVCLEKGLSS